MIQMSYDEIGTFAFFIRKNRLMVVIVTNRNDGDWILPKGQPEPNLSAKEVALMEVYEEAGVVCKIISASHSQCQIKRKRGNVNLRIYPAVVERVLHKWPEDSLRIRLILPVEEAIEKVGKKSLQRCMKRMAKTVWEHHSAKKAA